VDSILFSSDRRIAVLHFTTALKNSSHISPKKRDHLKHRGVHGRMGLEWILGRQTGRVWSGFVWLRIGTGSGFWWMRWWNFGFWCHGVSLIFINVQIFMQAQWRSSVSMMSDYGLDNWTTGFRSPTETENFFSSLCVQTGSGAHPASCTMGTVSSFPGGKARPGRDVRPLTPNYYRSYERVGAIPPIPPSVSMACSGTTLPLQTFITYIKWR
jgi:hypothetical protein